MRAEARLSGKDAPGQVRRGRALAPAARGGGGPGSGAITGDHVDVLAPLWLGDHPKRPWAGTSRHLVAAARTLTHGGFARTSAYWRQLADPDGTDRDAEAGTAGRDAYLVQLLGHGGWAG